MTSSYFQSNIENYLIENRLTISKLAKLIKVNEWNLRDVLFSCLISTTNPIVIKLANFINCEIGELFKKPKKLKKISYNESKLLESFAKINVDLFFKDEKVAEAFIE